MNIFEFMSANPVLTVIIVIIIGAAVTDIFDNKNKNKNKKDN